VKTPPATPGASAGRATTYLRTNRQRAVEARSEFDAAHADGQRSFKAGDLSGLTKAINKEREAIRSYLSDKLRQLIFVVPTDGPVMVRLRCFWSA